jgi:hypothetical protein
MNARTPGTRRLIDLAVIAVLVILGVHTARRDDVPAMPAGLCERDGVPAIPRHVKIAAVFATIDGPDDVARWSMKMLGDELRGRGFRETSALRFTRDDATVELVGPLPDEKRPVTEAIDRALAKLWPL